MTAIDGGLDVSTTEHCAIELFGDPTCLADGGISDDHRFRWFRPTDGKRVDIFRGGWGAHSSPQSVGAQLELEEPIFIFDSLQSQLFDRR